MFVLFEKSHGNGGTKVRYLKGGPFGPVTAVDVKVHPRLCFERNFVGKCDL